MYSFQIKKNIIADANLCQEFGAMYVQLIATKMSDSTKVFNKVVKYVFNNAHTVTGTGKVYPKAKLYVADDHTGCFNNIAFEFDYDIPPVAIADDHDSIVAYHQDIFDVLCRRYANILIALNGYDLTNVENVECIYE